MYQELRVIDNAQGPWQFKNNGAPIIHKLPWYEDILQCEGWDQSSTIRCLPGSTASYADMFEVTMEGNYSM